MTSVDEIFGFLCGLAPLELQMDFDNSGLLLGRGESRVKRALLSLDVSAEAASEAVELGAELLISHHPVIFGGLKSVTDAGPEGAKLLSLAENRVAVISMHTNLDKAPGGVNDVLIETLGAKAEGAPLEDGCGRVGLLPEPATLACFLARCRSALDAPGLRYYDSGRPVSRLAVMGGSGGEYISAAYSRGCDTYVTADIKYHQFLLAGELGINLIDAGHFCTENPVMPVLAQRLRERFPDVEFLLSSRRGQTVSFFI